MASKTIVQRISLEGGDAIKDQLKALGDAGEKAFNQIKNAAIKADFGKFSASLNKVGTDLATVGRRVALLGAGLTAAAAGAGTAVLGLAKSGGEAADAAGKAAEKTGLQVDAYGRLEFAAKQADVSQEELVSGMSKLNKAIAEAAKGTDQAADAIDSSGVKVTRFGKAIKKAADATKPAGSIFDRLGVKIKDANGKLRSNEAIVRDLAEAFSRMPDGALKSALAIELFGKSGANFLPFLNQGRKGLIDLGAEAERLGIVFTRQQAEIGDALGDSLDSVTAAAAGIRLQLGLIFAPGVTALAEGLRDIITQNKDAILAFGAALNAKLLSGISDLLFALIGADAKVKNPWILTWRDAILQFGRDFSAVISGVVLPLFKAIHDAATGVADAINSIFGTKLTGGQLLIGAALLQLLGVFRLIVSTSGAVIAAFRLIATVVATIFGEGVIAAATGFFGAMVEGATAFLALVAGLISWPALIVAALVAAGAAVFVFWDDIVAAAQNAIAMIDQLFSAESLAKIFDGLLAGAKQAGALFVDIWRLQIEAVGVVFQGLTTIVTGFVQGVVNAIGSLAAQLLPTWTQIGFDGGGIWATISGLAGQASTAIVDQVTALAGLLAPVWTGIALAGSTVWTTVTSAAATAFTGLTTIASTAIQAVSDTIGSLIGAVVDNFTGATSQVVRAADDIAAAIARATEISGDVQGAAALADALVAPFRQAQASIDQIMVAIRSIVQGGFSSLASLVNSLASQIDAAISRILSALRQAAAAAAALRAQAASSGGSGGGGAQGLASGGAVRGAGGPRTDSILAWLSNGEFVIQAAAVKKLGLGFLHAINNGVLPSLKGLRGFSLGGLADGFNRSMAIPRFADGGFAKMQLAPASGFSGKMVAVKLQYGPTLNDVIDLIGENDPVRKFQQFALGEAMTSAGRRPGK